MSIRMVRSQSVVRSQAVARNAAHDGAFGAALGLLLVSGLIASNLDLRQMVADSHEPLTSLAIVVAVVVAQCAVVAGLCGVAVRKITAQD